MGKDSSADWSGPSDFGSNKAESDAAGHYMSEKSYKGYVDFSKPDWAKDVPSPSDYSSGSSGGSDK